MAKPVMIGERLFRTQKSAEDEIRAVRDSYADGVVLQVEDDRFIRSVLALHPDVVEKTGVGISHFTVVTEGYFGGQNRHFVAHRHDGSETDFSFIHCVRPAGKIRNDRLLALRQAIKQQTMEFRENELASGNEITCPYEGVKLARDNCQIDHRSPWTFENLVFAWLGATGLVLENVAITPPADNQLVAHMTDPNQVWSWCEFHRQNARLRLLSTRGNLSGARRRQS